MKVIIKYYLGKTRVERTIEETTQNHISIYGGIDNITVYEDYTEICLKYGFTLIERHIDNELYYFAGEP